MIDCKTIDPIAVTSSQSGPKPLPALRRFRPGLIIDWHLSLLAIVYVRQSNPQQIFDHQESRERQYALANYAAALGWPQDRILIIDEDQGKNGKTAELRTGFHRILAEVTMEHVGLILGIEMSRLARSNTDWHRLLDMCGIFGTILADEDGLYDPRDSNDRLLLGLKGTMSEYELVTMHNRLERGRLHKAERGELFQNVPSGYVKLPTGTVALDPDEQARSTVQLVFDKFDELGSFGRLYRYLARNKICLGMRAQRGPRRGELEWRPARRATLERMLHHPIYAGAYSYGRRRIDHKKTAASGGRIKMRSVPMSEWKVLLQDRLPAYITWERYLANQQRLLRNRTTSGSPGVPRTGVALLSGLLVCGACGRRMRVSYRSKSTAYYGCTLRHFEGSSCCGLSAGAIDDLVAQQVLVGLEPASLELSVKAIQDIEQERERLRRQWEQRRQRAAYESERAERQYRAVEPENRLVARSLEKCWEDAMRNQRTLEEEYDRFLKEQPPRLSEDEKVWIAAMSSNIPALWKAPGTPIATRKEIIRLMVERVVVHVRADNEQVDAVISWQGGRTTQHKMIRSVARYDSLSNYDELIERIMGLRREGQTIAQIAAQINRDGYRTPISRKGYTSTTVRKLLSRRGLTKDKIGTEELFAKEWWLPDLAREIRMSIDQLRDWAVRGLVRARQTSTRGRWVVWADRREQRRLRELASDMKQADA
jgi:DNA invertase Pin-like site-specific DNA recombinase